MDMVQNYHVTDFAEELDAFVECIHEATLSHEGKREYIKYLFERWTNDDPAVGTFADQYEDALWKLCTDDADLRYWRDLLSPELPTEILDRGGIDEETGMIETTRHYRIKRLLDTYADLLDALDDEATLRDVYKQYYLDNRDFCLQYARQLSEADETDRAIEIAEEGLETFSNAGALRAF